MLGSINMWLTVVVLAIVCLHGSTAQTEDEECTCVVYYKCSATPIDHSTGGTPSVSTEGNDDGAGTTGENLIDIRTSTRCEHYLENCCAANRIIHDEGTSGGVSTGGVSTGGVSTGGVSTGGTTGGGSTVDHSANEYGCGHRNVKGLNYEITGDQNGESQIGEFPWMVAIQSSRDYGTQFVYQCGGSLISPEVVLTAAHCVSGSQPSDLRVRAGEWDTQTVNEQFPHQELGVKHVVIHERYYAAALHNDIALLFLESPAQLLTNIGEICLPIQGEIFDHSRCFASGWGKDVFGKEGKTQVILKKLELPVIPRAQCERSLRMTRLGKLFKLHESAICAGGEAGVDTCSGDGGSPLVCPLANNPSYYQQAGIVAWGIGCGERNTPGVYVNVAHFRHWIDDKMADYNVNSSTYSRPT